MHLKKNRRGALRGLLNRRGPTEQRLPPLPRRAGAFVRSRGVAVERDYVDETAALILTGDHDISRIIHATSTAELSGLAGGHAPGGRKYLLNYNTFMACLASPAGDRAALRGLCRAEEAAVEDEAALAGRVRRAS